MTSIVLKKQKLHRHAKSQHVINFVLFVYKKCSLIESSRFYSRILTTALYTILYNDLLSRSISKKDFFDLTGRVVKVHKSFLNILEM